MSTAAELTGGGDRQGDQVRRGKLQDALKAVREAMHEVVPGYPTKHGEGQVIPSEIPWVGVFAKNQPDNDPKGGYYVVYQVAADGSHVNLVLSVGTASVGSLGPIRARAMALRAAAPQVTGTVAAPVLSSSSQRATEYIAGSAFAKVYSASNVPSSTELAQDLKEFVAALDEVYTGGLRFQDKEPIHIFCPWVEDAQGPGIVKARKAIAEAEGAAWWVTNTPISDAKVAAFNSQIAAGMATYSYLYANHDSWRTRVLQVTKLAADVEAEPHLLAEGYATNDQRLSMKLAEFEPMPLKWRGEGLLGLRAGQPIEESVAARPAFSYVYSARPEDHSGHATPKDEPEATPTSHSGPAVPIGDQLAVLASESGLELSFIRELYDALESDMPQVVLAGPPGTGKTWLAKRLSAVGHEGPGPSYSLVQFHPSYSYEDFIEGLRPTMRKKQVVFLNEPGHLMRLVTDLPSGGPATLIIDELNRANIPSVFGELLYLLEYRNESASLRLSGEFRLPPEVRFIATMNTADRSVRSMDAALRRRFEFFELMPSADALSNYYKQQGTNEVPDLIKGFNLLNERLTEAIDRHHGIGHSFFMRKVMNATALHGVWSRKVRPLIEEYFFDEPHRVEAEFAFSDLWPSQAS